MEIPVKGVPIQGEKMGRPIQSTWFGLPVGGNNGHITVTGVKFADGTTASDAYIVKQVGSTSYVVQDAAQTHAAETVFMVNATALGSLLPGQCYILAKPYGASTLPCEKIAQFRLSVYNANGTTSSYQWSSLPAKNINQADLIPGNGQISSVTITNPGYGYIATPAVAFTGGGALGAATAVVTSSSLSAINVTTAGSGYTGGGVTIAAPAAAVTATATATIVGGSVTAIAPVLGGYYYSVTPSVVITGNGFGANAVATISNGVVTGFAVTSGGSGYTVANVTVSAPPASVQATATAVYWPSF